MMFTVIFSRPYKKVTPKVTVHCDGYCDFFAVREITHSTPHSAKTVRLSVL